MPINRGRDTHGCYYRWGQHGKKYYYQSGDKVSREGAISLAVKQGRAAHANGYG